MKRLSFTLLVFFLFLFLLPNHSLAHSSLERTLPQKGDQLETTPTSIEVWFQDPVVIHSNSIRLFRSNGEEVKVDETVYDKSNKSHIITSIPDALPKDRYSVKINVVALDGFVIKETFLFEVLQEIEIGYKEKLELVKQTPTDGEIVKGKFEEIELWFNQPARLTAIGLFDDKQGNIQLETPVVDPQDPNHLTININQPLNDGTYQVTWYARPTENVDPNTPDILDVFYFAVNEYTPIVQVQNGEAMNKTWFPDLGFKQVGYWFWFLGGTLLFGGSVIAYRSRNDDDYTRRWNRKSTVFLFLNLLGMTLVLIDHKAELIGIKFADLLSLKFIWVPVLQAVVFIVGYFYKRGQPFLYGIGLSFLPFVIGHASYPRYGGWFTFLMNELHLIAASLWMGGLLALIILPPKNELIQYLKQHGRFFSRIAFWSIIALALSGIYMTLQFIPSFTVKSLVDSQWGKALLIKMLFTFIVAIFGFIQRHRIKNFIYDFAGKFGLILKVEFVYGLLILFFASILVVATPSSAEQGVYLEESDSTIELDVTIDPLSSGLNELTLQFKEDIEVTNVTFSMPPSYQVNYRAFKVSDTTFKLTGNLLHAAGTLEMRVEAKTVTGELIHYKYQVVVPGEYRFNE